MMLSSYKQETLSIYNYKASVFDVHGDSFLMAPISKNDLRRIFNELDKNGDGLVSLEELNWLLERIGVLQFSVEELESIVGKPCLDFNEFLFFYDSISSRNDDDVVAAKDEIIEEKDGQDDEESDLVKAFKVFDLNGDGFITSEELQSVLGRLGLWDERCGKDCRRMICFYDTNLDGMVDFEEFKNMMFQTIS